MERDALFGILTTNIRAVAPALSAVEIVEDQNIFLDLGLDSLQALDVVSRTSKQLQVRLPLTAVARMSTLGDLVNQLQQCGAKVNV